MAMREITVVKDLVRRLQEFPAAQPVSFGSEWSYREGAGNGYDVGVVVARVGDVAEVWDTPFVRDLNADYNDLIVNSWQVNDKDYVALCMHRASYYDTGTETVQALLMHAFVDGGTAVLMDTVSVSDPTVRRGAVVRTAGGGCVFVDSYLQVHSMDLATSVAIGPIIAQFDTSGLLLYSGTGDPQEYGYGQPVVDTWAPTGMFQVWALGADGMGYNRWFTANLNAEPPSLVEEVCTLLTERERAWVEVRSIPNPESFGPPEIEVVEGVGYSYDGTSYTLALPEVSAMESPVGMIIPLLPMTAREFALITKFKFDFYTTEWYATAFKGSTGLTQISETTLIGTFIENISS